MPVVFYLTGCLSFIALLFVVLFLPEDRDKIAKSVTVSRFRRMWSINNFKGLLIFRFSNAVCRASILAFLPIFAARLHLNSAQIGVLVSLNVLLAGILQHLFGRIADRFSRRMLITAGNLITAASLLLTPFATSLTHLIILGILMGIGSGMAFPAAGALATELGRDHGMGNLMGFFNLSMSLGMIIGPIVSGKIMDLFGESVVFVFGGLAGLWGSLHAYYLLTHHKGAASNAYV
jgi:MFS family permease